MKDNYDYYLVRDGDRYFWVPFLLGGLGGAAVVGLSRPRPVYVNQPAQPYPYPYPYPPRPMPYGSGYSYGGSSYNYYY